MSSLRSQLFTFMLRHGHLLRGRRKRTSVITWETSIPDLRRETEGGTGLMGRLPAEIEVAQIDLHGLNAEWLRPADGATDRALLYFHGGGYVIGSAASHRAIVAKYVKGTGVAALVPDYRLAPEHPFPAALDDAVTAYRHLLDQGIAADKIVIGGDSAGGGLCLATLVALRDQQLPLPAGAFALSPWTDLANTGESLTSNAAVDMLSWQNSWTVFSKYYAAENDPTTPWISPLYADLRGLPPMLVFVGEDETLRDDGIRFAEKARAAGVDVKLTIGEGLFHCYPVCAPMFPEATQAMDEICAFITRQIGERVTGKSLSYDGA